MDPISDRLTGPPFSLYIPAIELMVYNLVGNWQINIPVIDGHSIVFADKRWPGVHSIIQSTNPGHFLLILCNFACR
jgi:hypothetical protein